MRRRRYACKGGGVGGGEGSEGGGRWDGRRDDGVGRIEGRAKRV